MIKIDHDVPKPPSRQERGDDAWQQRDDDDDAQVRRVIAGDLQIGVWGIAKNLSWTRKSGRLDDIRVRAALRRLLMKGQIAHAKWQLKP